MHLSDLGSEAMKTDHSLILSSLATLLQTLLVGGSFNRH